MKKMSTLKRAGLALALITSTLATAAHADPAGAGSRHDGRRGLMLGLNAGVGASGLDYRDDDRWVSVDPTSGLFGGLRVGYAFSPVLALSLESVGFKGLEEDEEDWRMGAGALAVTWHPRGKGFFVRAGLGAGGGDFIHPDTGEKLTLKNRLAGLCSVGYDWWVSDTVTLGISADAFSLDGGEKSGFEEDNLGTGGLTLQFSWYL